MYNTLEKSLNFDAINEYAEKVSDQIVNKVFEDSNTKITSSDLKSITTVEQINLFVIQDIFNSWSEHADSSKSDYFDYDNQEVKSAYNQYINTLSRHISLNKEQYLLLIKKAIVNCLFLLLCPYDYYHNLLSQLNKKNILNKGQWQKESKFIKINEELKERIDESLVNIESDIDVDSLLNNSCDKIVNPPEPIEPIFEHFKAYIKVEIETFFLEKKEEEAEHISLADDLEEKDQVTMNDVLESDAYSSDIHDLISINQRFLFIQELFDSDNNLYDKTLSEIDKMEDEYQAQKYLEDNISDEYDWDFDSDEVVEFMKVVRIRFQK